MVKHQDNARQRRKKRYNRQKYITGGLRQEGFYLGMLKGDSGKYFDKDHYNIDKMSGYNKDVVMDIDMRQYGRSTAMFYKILKNFAVYGGSSVVARRQQVEADATGAKMLPALKQFKQFANIDKYFKCKSGILGPEIYFWRVIKDDKGNENYEEVLVAAFISVKTAAGKKSIDFPNTNLFFYDECIPEDGKELPDEERKVDSLINTVLRDTTRPNRIYLFSNVGSVDNHFFKKLNVKLPKGGQIQKGTAVVGDARVSWVFSYGTKPPSLQNKDKKKLGMRWSALGDYARVSEGIDFLDDNANVVKMSNVSIEPLYNIYITNKRSFSVNFIASSDLYYIAEENPKIEEKYAFKYDLTISKKAYYVDRKSPIFKIIEEGLISRKMIFKNQILKNMIIDLLNNDY